MKKHSDEVNISSSQMTADQTGELAGEALAQEKLAQGHQLHRLGLYDGQQLCATVYADFTAQEVTVEPAASAGETAFGLGTQPSWAEFRAFAEKRCRPCVEPDLQGYLASLGMDDGSPLMVMQKDPEQVNRDRQWIKLEVLKPPALTGPGQKG